MRKILFSLFLFLLLFSSSASAWEDSAVYDTDISEKWTILAPVSGGVSIVSDPTGVADNTVIYMGPSAHYADVMYIRSIYPIPAKYISWIHKGGVRNSDGAYVYEISDYATGAKLIRFHVSSSIDIPPNSKMEIVFSSSTVDLFRNGELIQSLVNPGIAQSDTVRLTFGVTAGGQFQKSMYIDDIATSSTIGISKLCYESKTNITFTWSSQLMRSYQTQQRIDLYSLTNPNNAGIVKTWNIPLEDDSTTSEHGYISFSRSEVIGDNFGLYLLEMSRGSDVLTDQYFYFDQLANPTGYPEILFIGESSVKTEIRDENHNGGEIQGGGSVYLYPEIKEDATYNFTYNILEAPYKIKTELTTVYNNTAINSTTIHYTGLSNQNYKISVDGAPFQETRASGTLTFSGNILDGETVTIGADTYEFDDDAATTTGNIAVPIGGNASSTAENLASKINTHGTEPISASSTPATHYQMDISISDNPGIVDYQATVDIPYEPGMSHDFANIRFFDGETEIPYWIETKTDGEIAKIWTKIGATTTKIQCRWGLAGETASESNGAAVFLAFDDFSDGDYATNPSWTVNGGTWSVSDGKLAQTASTGDIGTIGTAYNHTTDYIYSAKIKANTYSGILFNWDGDGRGGFLYRFDTSNKLQFEDAMFDPITSWSHTWSANTEYVLTVKRTGNTFYFYINDAYLGSATSTKYSSGTHVGLYTYDNAASTFDIVQLRKYASTEPTLTPHLAAVAVVAKSAGSAANKISTSTACTNTTWGATALRGGTSNSTNGADTFSHTFTDWGTEKNHIISFAPDYTIAGVWGEVKNSETQDGIKSATVSISGANFSKTLYTDDNGLFYLTKGMEPGKTYTITVSKTGYTTPPSQTAITVDGSTTRQDFYMDKIPGVDGEGLYYSPHNVRFVVTDRYLFKRYDANVTISGENVTTETQRTGTDGVCVFKMTENTRYEIVTEYNGMKQTDYISPIEYSYYIILDATKTSLLPTSQFYEMCNITITKNELNSSHAEIAVSYSDTGSDTQSVYFTLGKTDGNNTMNALETSPTGNGNMTYTFVVQDYIGEDYVVKVNVDHNKFGNVEKQYGVNFPGSKLPFTGNAIIALCVLIFFVVAMQWGKADAHMGAVLICGLGWWFYYLDIFRKLGDGTNAVIGTGLGLATVYAILSMINRKRDEGGI